MSPRKRPLRQAPAKPPEVVVSPAQPAPGEDGTASHDFAYSTATRYAACRCGAERDLVLHGGKSLRVYRRTTSGEWRTWLPPCVDAHVSPVSIQLEVIDGVAVVELAADPETVGAVTGGVFSPVLASPSSLRPQVVTLSEGGRYHRHDRTGAVEVTLADLLVMRARYLLRRGEVTRMLPDLEERDRLRVCEVFFPKRPAEPAGAEPSPSPLGAMWEASLDEWVGGEEKTFAEHLRDVVLAAGDKPGEDA